MRVFQPGTSKGARQGVLDTCFKIPSKNPDCMSYITMKSASFDYETMKMDSVHECIIISHHKSSLQDLI